MNKQYFFPLMVQSKRFVLVLLYISLLTGSAAAQNADQRRLSKLNPIIELNIKCLIGGAQNKKWISAAQTARQLTEKNPNFNLFTLGGAEEGEMRASFATEWEVCPDFHVAKPEPEAVDGAATTALWNVVPRLPKSLSPTDAVYTKIVSDFLRAKGLAKPIVKIAQIYRVDLEGDGQEEVLISATNYRGGLGVASKTGDYSFVMMRKIVGGAAQNILVAGEFHAKNGSFDAPNQYKMSAIADLNGDGKMEIVVFGQYYEGSFSDIYEVTDNKAVSVLSCECGV